VSQAREPLKPAYAIWGEDRPKIERAVARLSTRALAESGMPPDQLSAGLVPATEVVGACEALSFGGLRLVIVREADEWKADEAAPLVRYLAAPNPATCLALVSTGAPFQRLLAAVGAVGDVLHFGPDPKAKRGDRARWFADHLVGEVHRHGGQISQPLAREVVRRVGEDAMALSQEAGKLAACAGDAPVDREMVEALVLAAPEARTYELADAITGGEAARAFDLLADLAGGGDPTAPIVIQMGLARHFRTLAAAQALGVEATPEALERLTGARGYPAQKAIEQGRALPPGAASRALVRLAALELDLRVSALGDLGRSREDGERFVLEMAARDLLGLLRAR
jgi:DNA polymerase III delta subunit